MLSRVIFLESWIHLWDELEIEEDERLFAFNFMKKS